MVKVNVIFDSIHGHIYRMTEAIAEGAREIEGAEVGIYQVPETLPNEVIEKMGAIETKKLFAHIPLLTRDMYGDVLAGSDALIFGTPTQYGTMTAEMRTVLDGIGDLWSKDAFVGKGGKRLHFQRSATRRTGIHNPDISCYLASSWNGYYRASLFRKATKENGRNNRWQPIWSFNNCRMEMEAASRQKTNFQWPVTRADT